MYICSPTQNFSHVQNNIGLNIRSIGNCAVKCSDHRNVSVLLNGSLTSIVAVRTPKYMRTAPNTTTLGWVIYAKNNAL